MTIFFAGTAPEYSVLDLGFDKSLVRLDQRSLSPEMSHELDGVNAKSILSGDLSATLAQRTSSTIYAGKTTFNNTQDGYRLGFDTDGILKFYIGSSSDYLNWDGTSLTITGTITATAGTIGGWTLSANDLSSGNVSINSTNEQILMGAASAPLTGVGVFIGLDGSDYEMRAGDPAGAYMHWNGSGLTVTGAIITTLASGSELAIQGWQYDGAFSATDFDTVAWASGTLTFMNGVTYSIDAGNTGNITVITYIYFDVAASTTVLQTTTTAATAVGANKVLMCVCEDNADSAKDVTYQVFGGQGGMSPIITTNMLVADAVTANEILANTITATELATTITYTGTLVIDTNGVIRGGQTGYDAGDGFFLGYSTSTHKFSIGDSSTGKSLTYDGSTVTASNMDVIVTCVAGEDMNLGRVVYSGAGINAQRFNLQTASIATTEALNDNDWCSQSFTATGHHLVSATMSFTTIENGDTITIRLRETVTGADLATDTFVSGTDYGGVAITFSTWVGNTSMTVGATYFLVISNDDVDVGDETVMKGNASNSYAGGIAQTSSDSGASFSAAASVADFYLWTTEYYTQPGRVYLGTSYDGDSKMVAVVGMTKETVNKGDEVKVQIAGLFTNFTNVIAGVPYFLTANNGTRGTITTTPPSNQLRVGNGMPPIMAVAAESHSAEEVCAGADWVAQSFTIPTNMTTLDSVWFWNDNAETGDTFVVHIRSTIDGADLYTSGALDLYGGIATANLVFASNIGQAVTPGNTYYVIISTTNAGGSLVANLLGAASSEYAGGSASTSSDSGANWGAAATVADFAISIGSSVDLRLTFDLE